MNLPSLTIGNVTSRLPIIQGGMAVKISLGELAGAVAAAGGIGVIAGTGLETDELRAEIQRARQLADGGVVGVNVMVAVTRFKELVLAALDEGVDLVISGAGFSRDVFAWCREADVPFVPILDKPRFGAKAVELGASAIVVEGFEAGGHLGTDRYMLDLLPEMIAAVDIPVIGAGGVVTGSDIRRVLELGAAGVQMGSRFAATVESSAPEAMKQMYIQATEDDIVLVKSPVGLTGRAVKNPFWVRAERGDYPPIAKCNKCLKVCNKTYCIMDELFMTVGGDVSDGLVFAGSAAARIHDIPTVADLMACLEAEYSASGA